MDGKKTEMENSFLFFIELLMFLVKMIGCKKYLHGVCFRYWLLNVCIFVLMHIKQHNKIIMLIHMVICIKRYHFLFFQKVKIHGMVLMD